MRDDQHVNIAVFLIVDSEYGADEEGEYNFAQIEITVMQGGKQYGRNNNGHIGVFKQHLHTGLQVAPEYQLFSYPGGNGAKQ